MSQQKVIERVAKALCKFAHPGRTLEETVSPSRELWQRFETEAKIAVDALGVSDEETLHTMIVAHDDCCGCINITQTANSFEVVFTCNECGKEVGRAPIPHDA